MLLMYHSTPSRSESVGQYDISAERFREHLDFLQKWGWNTARVCDLAKRRVTRHPTVVLTFDDGYANNYEGVFIPLAERGMVATWFIVTGCIGKQANWLGTNNGTESIMSADQIREIANAGMEIGSHTVEHPDLTRVDSERIMRELNDSRNSLEQLIGREVTSFAYPYGRFNQDTARLTTKCGYKAACTARAGWHRSDHDPMMLRRVAIFADDTASVLARKIAFADNEFSWWNMASYTLSRLAVRIREKQM
jgi:peptidoglycan/xylan/chitin deacetylase (PgdA/CDA1 family)